MTDVRHEIAGFSWCRREADSVLSLSLAGELDIHAARLSGAALRRAFSGDQRVVVLDLGAISFIDSSGLGLLISVRRIVDERGGQLVIGRLSVPVRRLIDAVRLNDWFEPVDDNPAAVPSCPVCYEDVLSAARTCARCGSAL